MRCPGCGENVDTDELEKLCREDFNTAHGQAFHNLRMILDHHWYWCGVWIGIAVDLVIVFSLWGWMSDWSWSWNGFLEMVRRVSEKSYLLLAAPFLIPIITAVVGDKLSSADMDVKEEIAYQKFKEEWNGCKDVGTPKEVL
ncbi:MAG: hypothetical protein G01um101429_423 [Parcubacteria group bacterium Gr01-1014_29]|nr:MAG: hypothetical protein G01um101429_423 [Parcubacteria group bacterium Gr01-1014_29]